MLILCVGHGRRLLIAKRVEVVADGGDSWRVFLCAVVTTDLGRSKVIPNIITTTTSREYLLMASSQLLELSSLMVSGTYFKIVRVRSSIVILCYISLLKLVQAPG